MAVPINSLCSTFDLESVNAGYRFGQEEETYNLFAGHVGYLGRLLIVLSRCVAR